MTKFLLLFAALTLSLASFCQELGTAGLSGTVADASGAVVTGAKITIQNTATGAERETATTSAGIFVVPELAPGDYEVRVTAPGFAVAKSKVHLAVVLAGWPIYLVPEPRHARATNEAKGLA